MTTLEFSHKHPKEFSKLPKAYQNDSCLTFGINPFGRIWCKPAKGQESILGSWISYYIPGKRVWSR
jgi:hypothetical protein